MSVLRHHLWVKQLLSFVASLWFSSHCPEITASAPFSLKGIEDGEGSGPWGAALHSACGGLGLREI